MRPAKLLILLKKEKKLLEALLHKETDAKQWQKYNLILLCTEKPRKQVAAETKIPLRTVERAIEAYGKKGINGLKMKKPPGRPSRIPKEKQEKLISLIDDNPYGWSTKQMRELIHKETGILFSTRHVYRVAQKWGFSEVTPRPMNRRRSKSAVYQFKKKQKG